jgi:hypothetical protein
VSLEVTTGYLVWKRAGKILLLLFSLINFRIRDGKEFSMVNWLVSKFRQWTTSVGCSHIHSTGPCLKSGIDWGRV